MLYQERRHFRTVVSVVLGVGLMVSVVLFLCAGFSYQNRLLRSGTPVVGRWPFMSPMERPNPPKPSSAEVLPFIDPDLWGLRGPDGYYRRLHD